MITNKSTTLLLALAGALIAIGLYVFLGIGQSAPATIDPNMASVPSPEGKSSTKKVPAQAETHSLVLGVPYKIGTTKTYISGTPYYVEFIRWEQNTKDSDGTAEAVSNRYASFVVGSDTCKAQSIPVTLPSRNGNREPSSSNCFPYDLTLIASSKTPEIRVDPALGIVVSFYDLIASNKGTFSGTAQGINKIIVLIGYGERTRDYMATVSVDGRWSVLLTENYTTLLAPGEYPIRVTDPRTNETLANNHVTIE